jgi:linoleoyl-CoA desaturase
VYLCGTKTLQLAKIQFSRPRGEFFCSLRKSVDGYFTDNGIDPTGDGRLYFKAGVIITAYLALFGAVLFAGFPGWLALAGCAAMGFLQALIGFNIMHDACHGSFSTDKRINYFFGLSMNALGSDCFMWKQKHNIVHHTFTNIDGADDDIAKSPLLRMSESQPRYKAHRFQHFYMPFLYAISTLYWVLIKDWQDYFVGDRFNVETAKMKPFDHLVFWSTKIVYFGLYIVLPASVWGLWPTVLGFVTVHAVLGLVMSFVFQLAHVVENVEFEHTHGEHTLIENEWAVHQIATTSDFAVDNRVVSWFLGGLNYQAIHHLFPLISHVHYPEVQKIVSRVCAEHGVNYLSYPTMRDALGSHFRHMKRLGREDVVFNTPCETSIAALEASLAMSVAQEEAVLMD